VIANVSAIPVYFHLITSFGSLSLLLELGTPYKRHVEHSFSAPHGDLLQEEGSAAAIEEGEDEL
jgi:hypothetical protein